MKKTPPETDTVPATLEHQSQIGNDALAKQVRLLSMEVDSLYQRIHHVQQSKLSWVKQDLLRADGPADSSPDQAKLLSRIDSLLRDGHASISSRNKYLVVQSRGEEAYQETFKESPFETQRSAHHVFCKLDNDIT